MIFLVQSSAKVEVISQSVLVLAIWTEPSIGEHLIKLSSPDFPDFRAQVDLQERALKIRLSFGVWWLVGRPFFLLPFQFFLENQVGLPVKYKELHLLAEFGERISMHLVYVRGLFLLKSYLKSHDSRIWLLQNYKRHHFKNVTGLYAVMNGF